MFSIPANAFTNLFNPDRIKDGSSIQSYKAIGGK